MNATLVNDWYLTTDTGGSMGSTDTSAVSDKGNATVPGGWKFSWN